MMGTWIAFIDIKRFYVRVDHQLHPSLGLRPLVVAHNSRVLEACGRAEAEGVSSGIPLRQVRCLCPQADIVTFNPDDCLPLYRQIWDIVAAHSPVVEPTDFHCGFADISKVVTNLCKAREWQNEVGKQIQQQTDLQPSIGIGPGRFVARVAAAHNAVLAEKDAKEFLAPLRLSSLDWLDAKLIEVLQKLGVTTLGEVAQLDRNVLIQQTGMAGKQLHDWITGKDNQPVQSRYPPPIERVAQTFDIEDREQVIVQALSKLCAQLATRLQDTARQARRLTLRVEDGTGHQAHTQQYSRPLQEASRLYQAAERLLKQLWQGQAVLQMELVAEDLQRIDPPQLGLWSRRRSGQVEQAIAAARNRYGVRAIMKASQLEDKRRFAQMILSGEGRFSW